MQRRFRIGTILYKYLQNGGAKKANRTKIVNYSYLLSTLSFIVNSDSLNTSLARVPSLMILFVS